MKIKVGIVGYGNLGKAVEELVILNQKFALVACFSRRLTNSKFNTKIEPYDKILDYKNKIDVLFLCGSSKCDIEVQAPELSAHFNTINSFDNHKKIHQLLNTLDPISKINKKVSLTASGWDPGLFSVIRTMFYAISNSEPITFWGKGISMGHSDAIRQIAGVEDAIEFTIPNNDAVIMANKGLKNITIPKHIRKCYVVTAKSRKTNIEKQIKNIPNYFKNQPTSVEFVSEEKLLKLKSKLSHKGKIITKFIHSKQTSSKMYFEVSMQSNPMFTASIMIAYAIAVMNLFHKKQYGSYSCLSIAPILLFDPDVHEKIIKKLC